MDFDHEPVGARGYGGATHRSDEFATARRVTRVDENRQMGHLPEQCDGAHIEHVSSR